MSGPENSETNALTDNADDASFSADDVAGTEEELRAEKLPGTKTKTGFVSWLALLFSLLALAAFGFDAMRTWQAEGETDGTATALESVQESLATTRTSLTSLNNDVSDLGNQFSRANATRDEEIKQLGSRLNDRLRQVEAMPSRLSSVEASLASLQGISTGARAAWLLAEAEYYMQIANAQLQLANNSELAQKALAHADERLVQLGDPRLTNIRQALSDELRSLEVIETPDIAGLTLTLASLSKVVDSLPLRREAVAASNSTDSGDTEVTGINRAWAAVKKSVGQAVSVRRVDEAVRPLIAPEAQYFLRANLMLKLEVARLALLRGEQDVFQQSLTDADTWLAEYYDLTNAGVRSARDTLDEIGDNTLSVAVPDISQSLRLLQQFNAINTAIDNTEIDREAADEAEQDQ